MRWNLNKQQEPWDLFDELAREMDRFFRPMATGALAPDLPLKIAETETGWEVQTPLPGVEPQRVALDVEQGVLRIAVEAAPEESETTEGDVVRVERHLQARERKMRLPEGVDRKAISASFKHGVLRVNLPKSATVEPRRIRVQSED